MSNRAWIALGSNLGDSRAVVEQALDQLERHDRIRVAARSAHFRTVPWGLLDQPDFINAAARLETDLDPQDLLDALLACERAIGRTRTAQRWGPRLIDLDLLLMRVDDRDLVISETRLQLPHPRLHERAFVLAPLADIDPQLVIPGHGTVQQCLEGVGRGDVERLDPAESEGDADVRDEPGHD